MKRILSLVVLLLALGPGKQIMSQGEIFKIQEDEIGRYFLVAPEDTRENDVIIDRAAINYIGKAGLTIDKPNERIVVGEESRVEKYLPIFKKLVRYDRLVLVYKTETNRLSLISLVKEKEESSYLFILFALSFLIMITADIILGKRELSRFFLSVLSIALLLAGVLLACHNNFFFCLLALIAGLISIVYHWYGAREKFLIFRASYYFLILVFLLFYFT